MQPVSENGRSGSGSRVDPEPACGCSRVKDKPEVAGSNPTYVCTRDFLFWLDHLRNQRNCRCELQSDDEAQSVIHLVKLCGSFRSQGFHELRPIVLAQIQGFVLDVDHALHQVLRFRVVHAVIVLCVILDQLHTLVADYLLVARVVPIDGPCGILCRRLQACGIQNDGVPKIRDRQAKTISHSIASSRNARTEFGRKNWRKAAQKSPAGMERRAKR